VLLGLPRSLLVFPQVDEPALREGLPLKKDKWEGYLGWAVDAFRYSTRGGDTGWWQEGGATGREGVLTVNGGVLDGLGLVHGREHWLVRPRAKLVPTGEQVSAMHVFPWLLAPELMLAGWQTSLGHALCP
jgi:hypothetical protein